MNMDFDTGTASEHRWICLECTEPVKRASLERAPFLNTSLPVVQYYWATRVRTFFEKYPLLGLLLNTSYTFFLVLAIGFAVNDDLRKYTALPVLIFVTTLFLHENIPLAPLPAGNVNAITNWGNKYTGAASIVFIAALATVVVSLGLELLNQYVNKTSEVSTIDERSDRLTKQVSTVVFVAIPVIYITYLIVTDTYTMLGRTIDPNYVRKDGLTNRQAVAEFVARLPGRSNNEVHMKSMMKKWS